MRVEYENNTYSIFCARSKKLTSIPHVHKEIELIYVSSGTTTAVSDFNSHKLQTGDVFVSFPNQIHYYKNTEPGTYYILVFSLDMIIGNSHQFHHVIPLNNVLQPKKEGHFFTALQNIVHEQDATSLTYKAGWLNLLIDELLSQMTLVPCSSNTNSSICNILNYCSEHFREDISLDTIGNHLHLSKYYISYLFNKRLHLSFNEYINSLRIDYARKLLKHSEFSIAYISEESGFGSLRTFNRVFSDIMYMTPSEYRKAKNSHL